MKKCEIKLSQRKSNRLKNYDYSENGCYFVTVCTKEKAHILCHAKNVSETRVGTGLCARPNKIFVLTPIGVEVEKSVQYINNNYNNKVTVENYCIMPNHLHLLITIQNSIPEDGRRDPSLRDIMANFKSYTTTMYRKIQDDKLLWQIGYYDHIIRNDEDYAEKYEYISNNPIKWLNNEYYTEANDITE